MKKLFLFLAFFGAVAFTSNAQSCTKSASASKKSSCCASKTAATNSAAAAKLASADASIEAKTCSKTGKVTYYKSSTCSVSGKTSMAEVEYDAATAKFVNVSPSKMAKESAVGGKTVKTVSATKKKSCCASKAASSCSKTKKVEN